MLIQLNYLICSHDSFSKWNKCQLHKLKMLIPKRNTDNGNIK